MFTHHNFSDDGDFLTDDFKIFLQIHRQEGVKRNLYKALTITAETPSGEEITCRVYQQVSQPNADEIYPLERLPTDRQPSRTYLTVIQKGAEESQLPAGYIDLLYRIPHNNQEANNAELRNVFNE